MLKTNPDEELTIPGMARLVLCSKIATQRDGMLAHCWPYFDVTRLSHQTTQTTVRLCLHTPAPGEKALENQEWDEPRIKLYVATNGPADLLPLLVYE